MSHPMNHARSHKIEKSRVSHITKGYARGGAVKHSDEAEDKALIRKMVKKSDLKADGEKSKHRMDRPKRAKGGRLKKADGGTASTLPNPFDDVTPHTTSLPSMGRLVPREPIQIARKPFMNKSRTERAKGGRVKKGGNKTIVNVITGGHPAGGAMPPGPPMGVAPPAPPPAAPPMAARPPMPPQGAAPGGPPPGMPMRAKGGRVQTPTGTGMAADTGVGSNKGDAVFNASRKNGTHMSHGDGKSDQKDVGRGRVVTFATGGGVKSFRAYGGRVESPDGVAPATKMPGGSGGGEARKFKERRAERNYAKAEK